MKGRDRAVESWRNDGNELLFAALATYGEAAAAASVDFFDDVMEWSGADIKASMPHGIYSRGEVERIGHHQAEKIVHDDLDGFIDGMAAGAAGIVYLTGMRTMLYQAGVGMNHVELDVETGQDAFVYGAEGYSTGGYEVRYRRIPQGIETCDFCLMLASRGAVYISEESAMGSSADDINHVHAHCVVAGTQVAGKGLEGSFARVYEGALVKLTTAAGRELTVTPNHPILTTRGWIRADGIKEGDRLFCTGFGHPHPNAVPDEQDVPPAVEDVVGACGFLGTPIPRAVPDTAEDFDGENAADAEVHVIGADGFLESGGDAAFLEPLAEQLLGCAHLVGADSGLALDGLSVETLFRIGLCATSRGCVGGCGLLRTLLGSHTGSADDASFGGSTGLDSSFAEPAVDDVAGDAEPIGDREYALAVLKRFYDPLRNIEPVALGALDSAAAQYSVDGGSSDAEFIGDLLGASASGIELDDVVACDLIENTTTHVYNLHTQNSWYTANGIITHNCDCIVVPCLVHYDGGKLIEDTYIEGYDTDTLYTMWNEWKEISSREGLSREAMDELKRENMRARLGRDVW